MAYAAGAKNSGITLSERSVSKTHILFKTFQNVCSSCPVVKPSLCEQIYQKFAKLFPTFDKVCPQELNKQRSSIEEDSLSLDEAKDIIRELAVELNRVLQFKKFSHILGKMKNKENEEEQQYYIFHWAEELQTIQTKQKEDNQLYQEKCTSSEKSRLESEIKWRKAKKILSDWAEKLKEMKENSVCPKNECKETLRDLCKQCKKGESSILPVMDWMILTVLHSQSSEANNGTEAAGPKRRSERLQAKPETPKSEPKPKKAPAKGKKAKDVEKAKPQEKKEDAKPEAKSEEKTPAENGETEEEANTDGEEGKQDQKEGAAK